jgi:Zn-finger nucleic acid-binding protein
MKCPIDSADLVMTERQGIEVDYCPKCRGIWLDRGELDKIIERSEAASPRSSFPPQPQPGLPPGYEDRDRHNPRYPERQDARYQENDKRYKKRKSSFLGDLFDFD